jgi:lysophospholipase L1-like esterase
VATKRWLLLALLVSLVLNATAGVLYLTRSRRPPPSADIYRAERVDLFARLVDHTHVDIVLLGDSLTDRGEWHELLGTGVGNRGISGDTIAGARARIASVIALKPKLVAIMIGINDLLGGASVEYCAARYAELLAALAPLQPTTQIIVQSVLPVGRDVGLSNDTIRQLNDRLRALCATSGCRFLDLVPAFATSDHALARELTTDGVHLNGHGYARWAEQLRPALTH